MTATRTLRHVKRSKKYDDIYKILAKDGPDRVFQTIKDLICFAAFLGYHLESKIPFEDGEALDDIQEHIFSKDEDARRIIYLVALADSPDMSILHPDRTDNMIETFEQYANGGMMTINQWFQRYATEKPQNVILSGLKELGFLGSAAPVQTSGGKLEV